jgi:hypothetical protein
MPQMMRRLIRLALPVALLTSAAIAPARADFLDDVRHTFQTDIPHFFQDDIPCAFGGQPTSGTKRSCNDHRAPQAARAATPPAARPPQADPAAAPVSPSH